MKKLKVIIKNLIHLKIYDISTTVQEETMVEKISKTQKNAIFRKNYYEK